jgi:hypothetical protein
MRRDTDRPGRTGPTAFEADGARAVVGVEFLLGRWAQAPISYAVREADP